jgi:hypothetical protein
MDRSNSHRDTTTEAQNNTIEIITTVNTIILSGRHIVFEVILRIYWDELISMTIMRNWVNFLSF